MNLCSSIMDCLPGRGDAASPKVNVSCGMLLGRARETNQGTEYVSFTKIPYALPPTGRLRFRKPLPADDWQEVYRAKSKCSRPLQLNKLIGNRVIGQEDCLHLNVYTPDLPITENQTKLPVMVWLYGGEFVMGDASEDMQLPEHIMDNGQVVVVTVNYRSGPLGYLCLESEKAPGNLALWDQNMALHWVKQNIAAFGGDPNNVTLVGEGSGAVCACYHLISPRSAGLLHKLIIMSGSLASLAYHSDREPVDIARQFAKKLGCANIESPDAILQQLQELNAEDIVGASACLQEWSHFSPNPWLPVVDAGFLKEPFIPGHPFEVIAKGKINKLPLIFGSTLDEGIYFASSFLGSEPISLGPQLAENWPLILGGILLNRSGSKFDASDISTITKIKEFYLGDDAEFNRENKQKLIQMFGDAFTFGGNEMFCKLINSVSAQPIYQYSYEFLGSCQFGELITYPPKNALSKVMLDKIGLKIHSSKEEGVSHGDDHFCFFSSNLPMMGKSFSKGTDGKVSDRMVQLWVNFSKFANPTPNQNDPHLGRLTWDPVKGDKRPYLALSTKFEVREFSADLKCRSGFWIGLIESQQERKKAPLPDS
ncbi:esterase E4-like [Tigriopus californicus]|uniref:esterase E4-like n=1 Tax=Tigriopus californicus TaxID=6832 RepID=UPI0027DAAA5E|nr:esterase E4-like [Tigriopus californicus]